MLHDGRGERVLAFNPFSCDFVIRDCLDFVSTSWLPAQCVINSHQFLEGALKISPWRSVFRYDAMKRFKRPKISTRLYVLGYDTVPDTRSRVKPVFPERSPAVTLVLLALTSTADTVDGFCFRRTTARDRGRNF